MQEQYTRKLILLLIIGWCSVWLGSFALSDDGGLLELTTEERNWLNDHPRIRLAPSPNFPPLEFFDEDDRYLGVGADYASLVESKLGIQFEIMRYDTWSDVVEATKRREVDVWLGAVDNSERREYMRFGSPYLHLPIAIIVREDMPGELSLSDLVGLKVAAPKGYASYDFVQTSQPGVKLLAVPSIKNGLERVSFGSADALVANEATASFYIEELGLTNLRFAGEAGYVMRLSMGARKDWPMLIQLLQKAQESLSDDERNQIYNDWVDLSGVTGGLSIRFAYLGLVPVALIGVLLAWFFLRARKIVAPPGTKYAALSHSWPILVGALAAVILVIFAALRSQSLLQERATRDVHNAIQTVLDATGHAVTTWFKERENEIQRLADLDSVRGAVLQLDEASTQDTASPSWAQGVFQGAIEPLLVGGGSLGVTVLGLNGELLASKNTGADAIWGQNDGVGVIWTPDVEDTTKLKVAPGFVENVLANPSRVTTTMPTRSSDDIFHSIVFGTVISDRRGSARAILALHIDPGQEFSEILQRGRIGLSGETYAINQFGQLISESRFDNDLIRIGLIDERGESLLNIDIRDPGIDLTKGFSAQFSRHEQPLTLMARTALAGQDGQNLTGYNDYRGVPVVGTWLWDSEYAFGITTEMDVSEAYEFFQSYSRQLWIGTTLTIFLILGLTVIFVRGRMQMAVANAELEAAYAIIKSHSERMEEELNVGRDIQMSMIPLAFPAFPERTEFVVNAKLQPAREVGGDFYDFYFSDDEHFCICIGDVSGKGVPSALFMAVSKTLIKSHASGALSTANIITQVNDEISSDNPSSMFVTVFIAIVNLQTGHFTCTNAGHNPPYVKRRDGQLDRLDHKHGPVIGALAGTEYGEHNGRFRPGDQLILYTDGVTEAINSDGELYSEDRLVAALHASGSQPSEDLISEILVAVEEFEKGTPQTDDITVLAFEYLGDNSTNGLLSWQRTIQNDITEIPGIIESIETFCREFPVPIRPTRKLKIVFDEILNNIISYGYTDDNPHQIEIEVDPISEGIVVRITDDGVPFNPLQCEEPKTDLAIDDREIGGLGIHVVIGMVDESIYERKDDLNILRLVLHFDRDDANLGGDSGQLTG